MQFCYPQRMYKRVTYKAVAHEKVSPKKGTHSKSTRAAAVAWAIHTIILGPYVAGCGASAPEEMTADGMTDPGVEVRELPTECVDTNPFRSEHCGEALKTLCQSHTTEQGCTAEAPFLFDDGPFAFLCGWAKVVTFADPSACTGASVMGRCEAGIIPGDVRCKDACDFSQPHDIYQGHTAVAAAHELIEMPCAPRGHVLAGPIGRGTAISNQQGSERESHRCNAHAPPSPDLCDCAPAACEAQ